MLEGMPEIAVEALDVPVRRGAPMQLAGLIDPIATTQYGTAVGLAMYGARERQSAPARGSNPFPLGGVRSILKNLWKELF